MSEEQLVSAAPAAARTSTLPTTDIGNVQGVMQSIGDNKVTIRAQEIRYNTDEEMVWQASPSLKLIYGPIIRWSIFLFICCAMIASAKNKIDVELKAHMESVARAKQKETLTIPTPPKPKPGRNKTTVKASPQIQNTNPISNEQIEQIANKSYTFLNTLLFIVVLVSALRIVWIYLGLKTTKYMASSQRLIIEKGVLVSRNIPYEIHRLGNSVITKPILQRAFGLSNLSIPANGIVLRGLTNADYVRDILRTGGQLEAQRTDKLRWR